MINNPSSSASPMLIDVTIESLGGLGDGIASYNGKPLFVAKSSVGDHLKVRIVQETQQALRGDIVEIIKHSPERQAAPCPHYAQCGGCTLQHFSDGAYRQFKTRMLQSAVTQAGFAAVKPDMVFLPAQTRRRVEFKIAKQGTTLLAAFHALRSHTPVIVQGCAVLDPALEAMIPALNAALSASALHETLDAVRLTKADFGMDMVLTLNTEHPSDVSAMKSLGQALGISRLSLQQPGSSACVVYEDGPVTMQLGPYQVGLPPNAFLQATAEGQSRLILAVSQALQDCASVADLFCGIGTYSFPLSSSMQVHAVEGDETMVRSLRQAAAQHGIGTLSSEQRDLFKKPLMVHELARFDGVVINPPRLGAKAQAEQLALSGVKTVVMVSCNPATFARDAKLLAQKGFSLESALGIDQFIWSQHLEIVAVFRR